MMILYNFYLYSAHVIFVREAYFHIKNSCQSHRIFSINIIVVFAFDLYVYRPYWHIIRVHANFLVSYSRAAIFSAGFGYLRKGLAAPSEPPPSALFFVCTRVDRSSFARNLSFSPRKPVRVDCSRTSSDGFPISVAPRRSKNVRVES